MTPIHSSETIEHAMQTLRNLSDVVCALQRDRTICMFELGLPLMTLRGHMTLKQLAEYTGIPQEELSRVNRVVDSTTESEFHEIVEGLGKLATWRRVSRIALSREGGKSSDIIEKVKAMQDRASSDPEAARQLRDVQYLLNKSHNLGKFYRDYLRASPCISCGATPPQGGHDIVDSDELNEFPLCPACLVVGKQPSQYEIAMLYQRIARDLDVSRDESAGTV